MLAGCAHPGPSDFNKAINSVEPGTSQARVLEYLGRPDAESEGVIPMSMPRTGPDARLLGDLPSGTRYQQWDYRRGDSVYHVVFVPVPARPGRWEVHSTRSSPVDSPAGETVD